MSDYTAHFKEVSNATDNGAQNGTFADLLALGWAETPNNHKPIPELGDYGRKDFVKGEFRAEFGQSFLQGKYIWVFKQLHYHTPNKEYFYQNN